MNKFNLPRLLISIVVCQLAGAIGALFTASSIPTWYTTLNKPGFTPPNSWFGPVWTTLYLLMGISLYLIWNEGLKKVQNREAVKIFFVQLGLNTLWSIVFFGGKSIIGGLLIIVTMWSVIALTIIRFKRINWLAGALLIPYLAWVSIATTLNYYLLRLN